MKKGFTLLELLIVIVIIGILASLSLPTFMKTFEVAKGKTAVAVMGTIRTAQRMYYIDYNSYYSRSNVSGLVPDYLPEDPNSKPNQDWIYSNMYWTTPPSIAAQRTGGWWIENMIRMDLNGNLVENWPWPPKEAPH